MDNEQVNKTTEIKDDISLCTNPKTTRKERDWRERLLDMDLLSPIYIFVFIVLFKDGKDGYDLHDAIIKFILTYNGQ